MSRPLRIEYSGAIYHITSRGIDRRQIFSNDKDREHFAQLLKEGADFFKVEVISYVLMSNHFHFLLRTKKANLSRFMQRLNVAYIRYFNQKYRRVGPLMQGRYKAIVVGSDEVELENILIVVKEIESWYLAGLSDENCTRLKLANIINTDQLTKEKFNEMIPKRFDSRIDFMIEMLRNYSIDVAKSKNQSFNYFINKYLH